MESELTLDRLSDDELLRRLGELVSHSRRVEADLVAHIGEVEERRLYAREASPSMFVYCTERLHLSEAEAYLRIAVARAARRHGLLLEMLRDGRLHLTGIAMLAPLLTRDNREALLARATHRSKRQIEELVAELSPRPDVPGRMRRLPPSRLAPMLRDPQDLAVSGPTVLGQAGAGVPGPSLGLSPSSGGSLCLDRAEAPSVPSAPGPEAAVLRERGPDGKQACPDGAETRSIPTTLRLEAAGAPALGPNGRRLCPDGADLPLGGCSVPRLASRPVVEPLSPARYKVQFTASAELRDKLERLQALMRSEVPDGDLAAIIERAVSEKLERLEARRYAKTSAPRQRLSAAPTSAASRHVPAAVRRAVLAREGRRCGYVDAQGRRCSERDRLEFHHRHPFGMGGDHSPGNVGLLCRVHNLLLAESDYGKAVPGRRGRPERTGAASPP